MLVSATKRSRHAAPEAVDVPIDRHRGFYGADPLATLVPDLNDNMTGVAIGQPTRINLSRR
jgi:hypothetical protein